MQKFNFKIEKKIPNALGRAGVISTPHGDILTPAFVPVGTKGVMKGVTPEMMRELGAQVVLSNTYHLYLQPGDELVRDAGGLHKMMHWDGPIMTDSGGFQVFSLGSAYGKGISKILHPADPSVQIPERSSADDGVARLATIGNDGVSFRSHIDGSLHYFTPEKSIEIQHNLGADIIFAFDECTSPTEDRRYQEEALQRTHAWAKRCLDFHKQKPNAEFQALFGIVQGGRDEELRRKSAQAIREMGFDGYGIGGSFDKDDLHSAVRWVNEELPEDKPRHLLGIGEPEDLFEGVENGVDLFDCVAPTRNARSGASLYTKEGRMNLLNAEYRSDFKPIEEDCGCYACKNFTRAYISHLFRAKEMTAGTLASIHNLYFITNLVAKMRETIMDGTFSEFKKEFLEKYKKQ
ncbi:MAG: tRNA guanosine(34) transglycosylase Tgt [Candidatus Pacebacteria bacterium]|nr:tRNA guanosine(34) transglycosylase Tgt [Candidatus Paceibacterota bacterium]